MVKDKNVILSFFIMVAKEYVIKSGLKLSFGSGKETCLYR